MFHTQVPGLILTGCEAAVKRVIDVGWRRWKRNIGARNIARAGEWREWAYPTGRCVHGIWIAEGNDRDLLAINDPSGCERVDRSKWRRITDRVPVVVGNRTR